MLRGVVQVHRQGLCWCPNCHVMDFEELGCSKRHSSLVEEFEMAGGGWFVFREVDSLSFIFLRCVNAMPGQALRT